MIRPAQSNFISLRCPSDVFSLSSEVSNIHAGAQRLEGTRFVQLASQVLQCVWLLMWADGVCSRVNFWMRCVSWDMRMSCHWIVCLRIFDWTILEMLRYPQGIPGAADVFCEGASESSGKTCSCWGKASGTMCKCNFTTFHNVKLVKALQSCLCMFGGVFVCSVLNRTRSQTRVHNELLQFYICVL